MIELDLLFQFPCYIYHQYFCHFYFNVALLLRETNLINGILFGAEAWYGVTKQQINQLESTDLHYLSKVFAANANTAKESFYLETGRLPIKFIIMMRRLMYLKHILNTDHNGLLYKFYKIQKDCSVKNDWIKQIELDKAEINLNLTDVIKTKI